MISPTYLAHSAAEAAYLYALGTPFIEIRTQANGHVAFAFENTDDRAWLLGQDWRANTCQPVNPTVYLHAYQTMKAVLRSARNNISPSTGATHAHAQPNPIR